MRRLFRKEINNTNSLFNQKFFQRKNIHIVDRKVVPHNNGHRAAMVVMRTECDINPAEKPFQYCNRSLNEMLGSFTDEQRKQRWIIFKIVPSVLEKTGEINKSGKNLYRLKDEHINMTHILGAIGYVEKDQQGFKLNIEFGFGKVTNPQRSNDKKSKDAFEIYGGEQVVIKDQDYETSAGFESDGKISTVFIRPVGTIPVFYMFIDEKSLNIGLEEVKKNIKREKQKQAQYNRMLSNCAHFVLNVLGIEADGYGQTPQKAGVMIVRHCAKITCT